jgi:hypothetical protein
VSTRIPWWVWALGIGGAGYVIYKFWGGLSSVGSSATNAVSSAIANAWLSLPLVGLPPAMEVLGNVKLPDGTLVPLNSLSNSQIRQSGSSVLTNIAGMIYQLSQSDAQGNFPATAVGPAPAGS